MNKLTFIIILSVIFTCKVKAQMSLNDMKCYVHVNKTGAIEVLTFKQNKRQDNNHKLDIFYYSSKQENNLMSKLVSIQGNIYNIELPKTKEKCEIKKVTDKNIQLKNSNGQYKWFTLVE